MSDEVFVKKVTNSDVEIVAITNHNYFDKDQFLRLQEKVVGDCRLWPGVELDIGYSENEERYHLLVICNPKNVESFDSSLTQIIGESTVEDFLGDINSIINKFDPLDCIFLPHFHKTPAIPEEEFSTLENLLSNKNRLIAEATNVRSMGIFANHGISSIAGSDIKDWGKYPNMELPELRLRIEEFEHFCKLLDRDRSIVKSILDKNTPSAYDVYPCKTDHNIKERHNFYSEINVIFGDKGTGKTEVIKSLIDKLKTEDIPYSKYISSETKDDLVELLDTSDMERSVDCLGIEDCVEDFSIIREWGDKTPVPISNFVEFHKTYSAKANQASIGWSRATDISDDVDTRLVKIIRDHANLVESKKFLGVIDFKNYLSETDTTELHALLVNLETSIKSLQTITDIESRSSKLVNFTLETFRTYTSAKTGSAPRPANTGFESYAKNRLLLEKSLERVELNLKFRENKRYVFLGSTGEKGKIEIEHRHRLLNDFPDTKSRHEEFEGNITKLRELKRNINKASSLSMSTSVEDELVKIKDGLDECNIYSISGFVGIYKQTVDKNRIEYSPSNGERSIIFIQRALEDKKAKVFLLDEPELSMANSYIDEVIRPTITRLGKQKKTIIMATHNANLAVRTLPYTTIYRSHESSEYKTYVGNPFTNELVNIKDALDKKNWKDISMKILEGGKEAFYDRGGIYESGR